ncbi:site-2 protease family protein [Streptomyces xylophagus]|uniref:site-2 protease family protein n=1 Tax=Streptomyces xylophagus TaxID=285514 RepID=UPI0005B90040|nr:site-2 protease family protein [Streptomyces xylophagus]
MDESGGSGQPRSGTNEPTEHATGATTPAADPGTPEPKHGDSDSPGSETSAQAPEDEKDATVSSGEREDVSAPPESRDEASTSHEHVTRDGGSEPSTSPAPHDRTDTDTDTAHDDTPAPSTPSAPAPADAPPAAVPVPVPPAHAHLNGEPKPGGAPTGNDHTDDHDRTPSHPNLPYAHTDPDARSGADAPHTDPGIAKGRPPRRPKEPGGGLLMGRPFGVPVYVAPSWFLVAALITWVFGGQLDRVLPELGAARYLVALFFAVAFYGSVLVHELAHTVAALRFKLPVRRIQLQFFGGVSEIEKEAETPGREFVLAFVGPLLSLILSGIFYLAMQPVEPGTVPGVLLAGLMVSNLIVAAFNLLPGLPLDGGRMLRAVVWKITGRPMSGTIAAAWVGRALAVSVLIGLPLLTQTGALGTNTEDINGMDTVTDALLAAILAAIIWTGAGNSLRMARLREHLPELRARNLTRRAVPVETNTPLSEALRRANAAGARALVVVDADGQPLSLVREAAIVGVPEHRRPWVSVSGLAQDLTDGMRVSAELAGEDLLDALRATPATEYLVVEETGEIYGVLSAADVERAFVKAMARPS